MNPQQTGRAADRGRAWVSREEGAGSGNSDLGTGTTGPRQECKGGRAPLWERTLVLLWSGARE